MCLILFAYHAHPEYKLIVAANRDEFYQRSTAPVHFWEDQPAILGGRDLEKMGTWMGVTTTGRYAALTNYRDPKESSAGKSSRGELVANYLKGTALPETFMVETAEAREKYPGYNLLAGDSAGLFYYSNIENKVRRVEPGIHGLSNRLLNTDWPKVTKGREGLKTIIDQYKESAPGEKEMIDELFALLQDADPAPDELLPKTGISREWERLLSPLFIKSKDYGTRSSTVFLMSERHIKYVERVFGNGEQKTSEYTISLQ
ncbi:NRDE family protein [Mesobacillus foraminis]|uniref:NRDE family protein n=1 Tax=Mesobacillus foraminis TaxID=279826 RepID=UPI001BE61B98|nr:NRDE family protein [Mesobacillus foraminis]MBT2759488.1 NRDE family protein [Mesobacillus foraminis]